MGVWGMPAAGMGHGAGGGLQLRLVTRRAHHDRHPPSGGGATIRARPGPRASCLAATTCGVVAGARLRALARLTEIAETCELGLEVQVEIAGRAVAVLGELETHHAFLAVLAVLLPEEHHEIRVGLERAALSQI